MQFACIIETSALIDVWCSLCVCIKCPNNAPIDYERQCDAWEYFHFYDTDYDYSFPPKYIWLLRPLTGHSHRLFAVIIFFGYFCTLFAFSFTIALLQSQANYHNDWNPVQQITCSQLIKSISPHIIIHIMNDLIANINYCPNIDENHRCPVERNNSLWLKPNYHLLCNQIQYSLCLCIAYYSFRILLSESEFVQNTFELLCRFNVAEMQHKIRLQFNIRSYDGKFVI